MHAESLQSCLTLYDPMDGSPPGSSVHGILQARIPGWVAIPLSLDLPDPGIEPWSPALQADSLPSELPGKPFSEEPYSRNIRDRIRAQGPREQGWNRREGGGHDELGEEERWVTTGRKAMRSLLAVNIFRAFTVF